MDVLAPIGHADGALVAGAVARSPVEEVAGAWSPAELPPTVVGSWDEKATPRSARGWRVATVLLMEVRLASNLALRPSRVSSVTIADGDDVSMRLVGAGSGATAEIDSGGDVEVVGGRVVVGGSRSISDTRLIGLWILPRSWGRE